MPEELQHPKNLREYATAATSWALDMEARLAACNGDKRAVKQWCEKMQQYHNAEGASK